MEVRCHLVAKFPIDGGLFAANVSNQHLQLLNLTNSFII